MSLFPSKGSGCSVKGYIEVLAVRECHLEPEYRRAYIFLEGAPSLEEEIVIAEDMIDLVVA